MGLYPTCSVQGCMTPNHGRKLCGMHYHRFHKNGTYGNNVSRITLWDANALNVLKENAGELSDVQIAQRLGRSTSSVRFKCWRLGLPRFRGKAWEKASFDTSLWSETDKAYIAGFVDGEGTITIGFGKGLSDKRRYGVRAAVIIGNTVLNPIAFIAKLTHKNIRTRLAPPYQPFFIVGIYSYADVVAFVTAILPYLQIKDKQARHLLAICQEYKNGRYLLPNAIEDMKNLNIVSKGRKLYAREVKK